MKLKHGNISTVKPQQLKRRPNWNSQTHTHTHTYTHGWRYRSEDQYVEAASCPADALSWRFLQRRAVSEPCGQSRGHGSYRFSPEAPTPPCKRRRLSQPSRIRRPTACKVYRPNHQQKHANRHTNKL